MQYIIICIENHANPKGTLAISKGIGPPGGRELGESQWVEKVVTTIGRQRSKDPKITQIELAKNEN